MQRWSCALFVLLFACLLGGCETIRQFRPAVQLKPMTPAEYITLQRGDLLTTGQLSVSTLQTIRVTGTDEEVCKEAVRDCIAAITVAAGIDDERRLSALSELWLQNAFELRKSDAGDEAILDAWMEAARHAYAYLFFTQRAPGDRAFEDRQTQVRDWYSYAAQEAITQLFERGAHERLAGEADPGLRSHVVRAGWDFRLDLSGIRLPKGVEAPSEILPASSLAFQGMHNTWRRDGFGAEMVAVMNVDPVTVTLSSSGDASRPHKRTPAWSEMPSPGMTVLFRFPGDDLAAVLATREVHASVHDPYAEESIVLQGETVPLAANFTAGYGLWLARSGFNRQSLRTLFGRGRGIDRPHLFMMQPYDPDRRIILMLHGLASSPETWVNVANEIQGDAELRRNFQIWQVYYPTNMPVVLNHFAIRALVTGTLQHFDPGGQAQASHDMVLIGHSMGAVISRLMVSTADQQLWDWAKSEFDINQDRLDLIHPRLDPLLRFEPMPQVERVVFIAAPHRGTFVAGSRLGHWAARLVRLPLTMLESFAEILQVPPDGRAPDVPERLQAQLPNSINNLDERDPFVRAAADLPISPAMRYHSIIARTDPSVPLEQSDDGLVPYLSAHLPGAVSEKVIVSGHSVQQTAAAILEVRRILHEDLGEAGPFTPGSGQDAQDAPGAVQEPVPH